MTQPAPDVTGKTSRTIRAPRGSELTCRSWLTEAPYRMIQNNLDPEVAENPDELIATMVPAQLNRHIQPREVGKVVAFLLSDEATIIRGQSINVDGGDTPY